MAFDLETTGLSPLVDEIIEIAAIKVIGNKVEYFEKLIKPEKIIPEYTINIHGITNEMVKDCESIVKVLPEFIEFSKGMTWVAHNAKFDVGFVVFDMHKQGIEFFDSEIFCSCKLSRRYVKGSENHKLATLSKFFNIQLENHHRALDDTFACLRVFTNTLKLIQSNRALKEGRILNVREFKKAMEADIPEKIQGIKKYLEHQTPIEIKYKGGSKSGQFRKVRPISFLPLPQGSVLYAHCLESDMYKSFSLKKIVEYKEIEEEKKTENKKEDKDGI